MHVCSISTWSCRKVIYIIGASLSEPHTSGLAGVASEYVRRYVRTYGAYVRTYVCMVRTFWHICIFISTIFSEWNFRKHWLCPLLASYRECEGEEQRNSSLWRTRGRGNRLGRHRSLDQARRAAVTSDKTRGNSSFQREGYSLTILCHTFFFNDSCMFKYTVQRMWSLRLAPQCIHSPSKWARFNDVHHVFTTKKFNWRKFLFPSERHSIYWDLSKGIFHLLRWQA